MTKGQLIRTLGGVLCVFLGATLANADLPKHPNHAYPTNARSVDNSGAKAIPMGIKGTHASGRTTSHVRRYIFDIQDAADVRLVAVKAPTTRAYRNADGRRTLDRHRQPQVKHSARQKMAVVGAVRLPGRPLRSFDISTVSLPTHLYAFSDRSNRSVDLIDTRSDQFAGRVGGFTGTGSSKGSGDAGPNGLVAVGRNQVWAGDGNSTIKVIDLTHRKIIATIATGGHNPVDELGYDPRDHLVIAANNADKPPFLTFISTRPSHRIEGRLTLAHATDGLEQPLWDPDSGEAYVAIPELDGDAVNGGIAVINPRIKRLIRIISVTKCMPAGLAAGPKGHLLVGCSDDAVAAGFAPKSLVVNIHTGKVVAPIRQVGGSDEVWFDGQSARYHLAAVANTGGPALGIINARTDHWLGNRKSGPHAHSVAADETTGQVFVPTAAGADNTHCRAGCVLIYGQPGGNAEAASSPR